MKKVLVTGASGFAGRHLCRYLIAKKYRVTGTYFNPADLKQKEKFRFVLLNLLDRRQVNALVRKVKPDYVFHLAAQSISRVSFQKEQETLTANAAGTIILLNALRAYAPYARFLLASTSQVYGRMFQDKAVIKETDLLWPENPYGASKALAELACADFNTAFGVQTLITRSFNHIGPGQRSDFVFSDWCRQIARAEIKKQKPVLDVGNLNVRRDFLHVEDVVRAYELLMTKGKPGTVYNLCSGRPASLKKYLEFLLKRSKICMEVRTRPSRLRSYDPPLMTGSSARMRALGWRPRRTVFQALEEMLEDWRRQVRE